MVMEVPLLESIRDRLMLPECSFQEIVETLALAANDEKIMLPKTPVFDVPQLMPQLRESQPKAIEEVSMASSLDLSKSPSNDSSPSISDYSSGAEECPSGSTTHNSRGRKRMYTDEERRRRKNRSSKLSRDKHSRRVKANYLRLQRLQTAYEVEENCRQRQRAAIIEKRKELCPSCLSIIDQTLEKLRNGENFIHLKWTARNCTGRRHLNNVNAVVIKEEIIESEVQHG